MLKARCKSSRAARLALMSSRTAAWGQPPVSIALMRSGGRAECRIRNSQSSRVKMSLVTAAMEYCARRDWQRASIRAVLPEPTGLHDFSLLGRGA